jgi:hypothetical protein
MATRQSTEHNIRPRVLAAVLRLQRFTVQEVVSAANLENRKQAYAQLQFLAKQGYISGAAMAAEQPNRPPTLYRIEPEKIAEIAKKVAGYGVLPVETSLRARDAAIARARETLTEVERQLSAMKPVALNRTQLEQTSTLLEKVAKQLEEVDIELDTAKMESAEQGEGDREISQTALRLEESRNTIRGLEKALRIRHSVNWITNVVKDWTKKKPNTIEQARKLLQRSEGRLATEIVLDLLSPGFHNHELMPAILASQAIRTNDLDLISLCLMRLSKETSAWWRYNLLNTEFLQGRFEEAYEKWRDIYVEVAQNTHCALDKERALGIFIYEPKEMKLDRLLPLFKKYEVSIVSPRTLGFWTLNEEIVRPLLVDPVSEARSEAGPLTSTVALTHAEASGPLWELYAYGPLTAAIRQWPGAPPLRVAASVDCLRPEEIDVPRIANALRFEKGMVVLEKKDMEDERVLRTDVETALGDVEEVAFFAGV